MGLHFDKSDVSWSYSSFNEFRVLVASLIGIDENTYKTGSVKISKSTEPLAILLLHSDSDSNINAADCKLLGHRLKELIENNKDKFNDEDGDYDSRGMRLALDIIACGENGEGMTFL